jgi:MerR family transcriptional regulator, light-induced transcriptional regulator
MGNELLTSAQVADLLGVTPGTVKRWTTAGLLSCVRTAGGHRRFDPREVGRVRARGGAAETGGAAAWLDALLSPGDRAMQAALASERTRTGAWWRVAEGLGRAAHEIGRRWERGELDVVEEHAASERFSRAVARVADSLPARRSAPEVLLATARGEEHTLGLALVELCLRELGWRTLWIGSGVPARALADAIGSPRRRFDAVAVSASACARPERLARQREQLSRVCAEAGVALVAGGGGEWGGSAPGFRVERSFGGLRDWAAAVERGAQRAH